MPVLYLLIFVAGATTIGTQILLYAGAAQLYGLSIRATGLGWASGIGRNGAIVGPLLGGALMAIELPLQLNFMAFAIPGAIAALAMTVFALNERRVLHRHARRRGAVTAKCSWAMVQCAARTRWSVVLYFWRHALKGREHGGRVDRPDSLPDDP